MLMILIFPFIPSKESGMWRCAEVDYLFVELFVLRLESGCLPLRPANTGRLPLKPVELLLLGLLGALKKLGPIDPLRCMDP